MKFMKNERPGMGLLQDEDLDCVTGGVGTGITGISQGMEVILNGTVYTDSYGSKPNRTYCNYRCRVSRVATKGSHPILLGDTFSNQLGWVAISEITII